MQYGYIRTTVNVSALVVHIFYQNFSTNGDTMVLIFWNFFNSTSPYISQFFSNLARHFLKFSAYASFMFREASQNLSSFRQLFFQSFQGGTKGKMLKTVGQRDGGPKGRWDKGMVGQRDSGPKGQWGQRVGGPKRQRAKGTVGQRDGWKCFLWQPQKH